MTELSYKYTSIQSDLTAIRVAQVTGIGRWFVPVKVCK
jgi:hypothetical protein